MSFYTRGMAVALCLVNMVICRLDAVGASSNEMQTALQRAPQVITIPHTLTSAALRADGDTIVVGTDAGEIIVVNNEGRSPRQITVATVADKEPQVAYAPDEATVLAALGKTARVGAEVWRKNVTTGKSDVLKMTTNPTALAFNKAKDWLLVAAGSTITLRAAKTGAQISGVTPLRYPTAAGTVEKLIVSKNGEISAALTTTGVVYTWDFTQSNPRAQTLTPPATTHDIAITSDGTKIVLATVKGLYRYVWDERANHWVADGAFNRIVRASSTGTGVLTGIAMTPDDLYILATTPTAAPIVWGGETGRLITRIPRAQDNSRDIQISADGSTLALYTHQDIQLWPLPQ